MSRLVTNFRGSRSRELFLATQSRVLPALRTYASGESSQQSKDKQNGNQENASNGFKKYGIPAGLGAALIGGTVYAARDDECRFWMVDNVPGARTALDKMGFCVEREKSHCAKNKRDFYLGEWRKPEVLPNSPIVIAEDSVRLLSSDRAAEVDRERAKLRVAEILERECSRPCPQKTSFVYISANTKPDGGVQCEPCPEPNPGKQQKLSDHEHFSVIQSAEESARLIMSGHRPSTSEEIAERSKKEQQLYETRLAEREKKDREYVQKKKEKEERIAAQELEKKIEKERKERDQAEQLISKIQRNEEMEQYCSKTLTEVIELSEISVKSTDQAIKSSKEYLRQLRDALDVKKDSEAEIIWPRVTELNEQRCQRMDEAHRNQDAAQDKVVAFLQYVEQCKEDTDLKENRALEGYKRQINAIAHEVKSTSERLRSQETVDSVMKHYFQLLHKNREGFRRELLAIVPQIELSEKGLNLSVEELNALLAHAHRRIYQLKEQLREQQELEEQRLADALCEQKKQDMIEANTKINLELDKQFEEMQLDKENELMLQQRKFDSYLTQQLNKQASEHKEHLQDMLALQQKQLMATYDLSLRERLAHERHIYIDQISKYMARLRGLEIALEERSDLARVINEVQDLTSSAMCFMYACAQDDHCYEDTLTKLEDIMNRCKSAADDDSFVQAVINAVPVKAYTRGIWTPSTLQRMFKQVYQNCKDKIGGTFNEQQPKYTKECEFLDPSGMSPNELLVQANFFMDKKCYAGAVRAMVQLEGEARKLSQEWIEEMRMVLECRQAAETLHSYSKCKGMGTIF